MATNRLEITAVVHTYNEEKNIEACLETLRWVDELIVVDMYSTDRTAEIARRYTGKVLLFENMGYADPARDFAIQQATKDWILFVDADERVTEQLKKEIIEIALTNQRQNNLVIEPTNLLKVIHSVQTPDYGAYKIPIADFMFGRWVQNGPGAAHMQRQTRLLRKGKCSWPVEVHSYPQVQGAIGLLEGNLLHLSHLEVSNFVGKLNKYTSFQAQERFTEGKKYSWLNTFLVTFSQFFNVYIKQKAYKEGAHGIVITFLMVFYTFTYRAKLWELHFKKEHPDASARHEQLALPEKPDPKIDLVNQS
jgi:glycosyltransferase involved in cell wall biosynthesis